MGESRRGPLWPGWVGEHVGCSPLTSERRREAMRGNQLCGLCRGVCLGDILGGVWGRQ